jgi:3-hydroxyacyl-[acyl-carrier-protein] dehydratase
MSTPLRQRVPLQVEADHPSLAGHFPGRPVVPGVLLLDHVLDAVEAWLDAPLPQPLRLPQVKFVQPLLPGEPACIELEREAGRVRFRVLRDEALVASGELALSP